MAKDGDECLNYNSSLCKDSESNKSFVKKVKSRVSGFLPTTLSKWFGTNEAQRAVIRQREEVEEEDDESFQIQPPTKRARPSDNSYDLNFISTPVHVSQHHTLISYSNNINNAHKVFQEPMPGPSGVKSRKLLIQTHYHNGPSDMLNGDKDSDSGESTSGYSSMPRIGSKEQVSEITDKHNTPANKATNNRSLFNSTMAQERSLFNDRTSPPVNSSLSSRRPSFNASIGSPNFMDRTLSTKRIVNSPFYGGRTTYGGASAYSRHLINKSPEKLTSLRNFVQAKPVHEHTSINVTLSKTAKRILNTIEQYTSPTEDVKRIPNPKRQKHDGLISKYTSLNPYIIREKVASNRELNVPTMSDLLKMKLKERLQDSTVSVRSIATNSNSPLNVDEYKLRSQDDNSKNTNKMKTKVAAVRQRLEVDDTVETVKLPEIKLPISTLPSFDFTIPSPIAPKVKEYPKTTETLKKTVVQKPISNITNTTEIKDYKNTEYKFSNPLIIAENLKSIKAINNFKFSEPVNKNTGSQTKGTKHCFKTFNINSANLKKIATKNCENGTNVSPAKDLLKTGSVMDILGKQDNIMDKFKPAKNTWECETCMIRNAEEKTKCVACETPRHNEATPSKPTLPTSPYGNFKIPNNRFPVEPCGTSEKSPDKLNTGKPFINSFDSGFGNAFKMTSDKWECEACMVRNEVSTSSCVACSTPKPNSIPKQTTNGTTKPLFESPLLGFGDKFKVPQSTWECSQCLVRNPDDKINCLACEFNKPGTKPKISNLLDTLKKTQSDWECVTCMVRNGESILKCVCCETPKPGSKVTNLVTVGMAMTTTTVPKFNFGVDKAQVNTQGFTFGIKPKMNTTHLDQVDAGSVFGEAKKTGLDASAVFGEAKKTGLPAPTTGFSFGVNGATNSIPIARAILPNNVQTNDLGRPAATSEGLSNKRSIDEGLSLDKPLDTSAKLSFNGEISKENGALQKSKPVLQFGSISKESNTTLPDSKNVVPTSSLFSFGATPPASKSEIKAPVTTATTPVFKFNTDSKPVTPVAPMFGTPKTNSPIFALKESTPISNNLPAPTFGTPTASFSAPVPAPKENQFSAKPPAPAAAPPVFSFGASKPAVEVKAAPIPSTMFSSGSNAPSAGGFTFAAPAAAVPAVSSGGFNFSAPKTDAAPSFGAHAFGTPAAAPPAFGTPATNLFGAAPAQPVQNGNFSFGSGASSAPKEPGFGFSAAATTASTGFNFGSIAATTPQAGFNFGGASAMTPNFSAEAKPTFNFTANSAPNMFSAQSSGDQPQKSSRVIRRAHRRTQR